MDGRTFVIKSTTFIDSRDKWCGVAERHTEKKLQTLFAQMHRFLSTRWFILLGPVFLIQTAIFQTIFLKGVTVLDPAKLEISEIPVSISFVKISAFPLFQYYFYMKLPSDTIWTSNQVPAELHSWGCKGWKCEIQFPMSNKFVQNAIIEFWSYSSVAFILQYFRPFEHCIETEGEGYFKKTLQTLFNAEQEFGMATYQFNDPLG